MFMIAILFTPGVYSVYVELFQDYSLEESSSNVSSSDS